MALPLSQQGTIPVLCFKESYEFSTLLNSPHSLTLKAQAQGVKKGQDEAQLQPQTCWVLGGHL